MRLVNALARDKNSVCIYEVTSVVAAHLLVLMHGHLVIHTIVVDNHHVLLWILNVPFIGHVLLILRVELQTLHSMISALLPQLGLDHSVVLIHLILVMLVPLLFFGGQLGLDIIVCLLISLMCVLLHCKINLH
jgi:hypothetical protein